MTPHHESAIEMARVALRRAEHAEVKRLAGAIASTQVVEIDELVKIHTRIFGFPVSQGQHGTLGMDMEQMGMGGETAMASTIPAPSTGSSST